MSSKLDRGDVEASYARERALRAPKDKKTALGHCDTCGHWGILYPVRRADGGDPEETDVVCVCANCLSAQEKGQLNVHNLQ